MSELAEPAPFSAAGSVEIQRTQYRTTQASAFAAPTAGSLVALPSLENQPPLQRIPPVRLDEQSYPTTDCDSTGRLSDDALLPISALPPVLPRIESGLLAGLSPPVAAELPVAEDDVLEATRPLPPVVAPAEPLPSGEMRDERSILIRPASVAPRGAGGPESGADSSPPWVPLADVYAQHWQQANLQRSAIAARAEMSIEQGFMLAEKGALYSARAEFLQALQAIAQALDASGAEPAHSELLLEALQALREADDFAARAADLEGRLDVASLSASHRTPALAAGQAESLPGVLAMQRYYAFAQDRLAAAGGGAPAASRALFALGKIYMVLGERSLSAKRLNGPKAMAFHQAALMVDPRNHQAANELGVLLARFGQLQQARSVLQHGVAVAPSPETWHNLAAVHQRLGEEELARQAWLEAQRAVQHTRGGEHGGDAIRNPLVTWVDSQTFARGSLDGHPSAAAPAVPAALPQREAHRAPWTW